MREKTGLRRIWRKGPIHAYVQNMVRSTGGVARPYKSVRAIQRSQDVFIAGGQDIMPKVLKFVEHKMMSVADLMERELEWLGTELYDQNPWDPEGPNDPPLHSAEAWKITMKEGKKGQIVVSVSNPKDYMQFLEEGWSEQAPAGWIAAIYREFWMRVKRGLRRI